MSVCVSGSEPYRIGGLIKVSLVESWCVCASVTSFARVLISSVLIFVLRCGVGVCVCVCVGGVFLMKNLSNIVLASVGVITFSSFRERVSKKLRAFGFSISLSNLSIIICLSLASVSDMLVLEISGVARGRGGGNNWFNYRINVNINKLTSKKEVKCTHRHVVDCCIS